jgi:hypothetical protein
MSKEQLIQGIYNEYLGRRDQVLAELQVYLDKPAGIGEHGDIAAVVKEKLEAVDNLNSVSSTMRDLFMSGSTDEKVDSIDASTVELPTDD